MFTALLLAAVFMIVSTCMLCIQKSTSNGLAASQKRSLPIYSVETSEKKIAISFDCAWGTDHTDKLLEIMAKNDVLCTLFAVQFWVEK